MAKTLKLQIVTPQGPAYCEDAELVTLPGVEGQLGIYPDHVRLMTQMVPGEIIVRKGRLDNFLAVGEGLIEVTGDQVNIVTDMAIAAENIDEAKVEEARQPAAAAVKRNMSEETIESRAFQWATLSSESHRILGMLCLLGALLLSVIA